MPFALFVSAGSWQEHRAARLACQSRRQAFRGAGNRTTFSVASTSGSGRLTRRGRRCGRPRCPVGVGGLSSPGRSYAFSFAFHPYGALEQSKCVPLWSHEIEFRASVPLTLPAVSNVPLIV